MIARLAANQHGVVATAQLLGAGLLPSGITDRLRAGRLHRIHRGVYAVGHPRVGERGRWMAAVLACGQGAVLSHTSAAELWGIRRRRRRPREARGHNEAPDIHITVPRTAGARKRVGIVLHRSSTLIAGECTRNDGIPVTTPTRTLRDLRPLLSPAGFSSAVREAEFLGLRFDRQPDLNGTRSELEQRMLSLCRRHRIPQPEVNVRLGRYEVDFLWGSQRLVVEVDGWESHRSRSAFEEDRARDASLKLLGYEVLRFTWRQLTSDRAGVARTIRSLLKARRASGGRGAAGAARPLLA